MKRILLQTALCGAALLAASTARATPARVVAMGDLSRYVTDDTSVLQYPGLMPAYSHFLYLDLGGAGGVSPGLNDLQAASVNGGAFIRLSQGLHLGILTSDYTADEGQKFMTLVAASANAANTGAFGALAAMAPMRRYDLVGAYELSSRMAAGLRLSYGTQGMTYTPDPGDKDSAGNSRGPDSSSINRFDASFGLSGQLSSTTSFDLSLGYDHYGFSYVKDSASGLPAFSNAGGNGIQLNARGRFVLSRHWDIVPQFGWRGTWFGLEEDWTVPMLGKDDNNPSKSLENNESRLHSMSLQTVDFGAATVLRASPVAEFWVAVGMQYNGMSGTLDYVDKNMAYLTSGSTWFLSLPYIKLAAEVAPLDWLRLRMGIEKYAWIYSTSSGTDTTKPTTQSTSTSTWGTDTTGVAGAPKDFALYTGASLLFKGFSLDLLLDNGFYTRGPLFLTGAAGNWAVRASLSYAF